ncbi:hypothetical protein CEXT_593241 [Caerostris extrusa]|uniref:Uncharacterized protein n=1 Tax=Caerostris extrusa TaxID=172846 RepID=A0AAV4T131_CAEEX|nr:hypothetical protein CEXT_593241 [Caerostris extrusa]
MDICHHNPPLKPQPEKIRTFPLPFLEKGRVYVYVLDLEHAEQTNRNSELVRILNGFIIGDTWWLWPFLVNCAWWKHPCLQIPGLQQVRTLEYLLQIVS